MTDLAGATDRGRPDTSPKDAGEFAARWNAKTLVERDHWVDVLVETQLTRERLERELAAARQNLEDAPHSESCDSVNGAWQDDHEAWHHDPCTCWKSTL